MGSSRGEREAAAARQENFAGIFGRSRRQLCRLAIFRRRFDWTCGGAEDYPLLDGR